MAPSENRRPCLFFGESFSDQMYRFLLSAIPFRAASIEATFAIDGWASFLDDSMRLTFGKPGKTHPISQDVTANDIQKRIYKSLLKKWLFFPNIYSSIEISTQKWKFFVMININCYESVLEDKAIFQKLHRLCYSRVTCLRMVMAVLMLFLMLARCILCFGRFISPTFQLKIEKLSAPD